MVGGSFGLQALSLASIKASQQSVHLTLGILRQSQAVSHTLSFFWLDGFAVPAPAQVTHAVGTPLETKSSLDYLHMCLTKQSSTKRLLRILVFITILTACSQKETQFFIFRRSDPITGNLSYYKTDLYNPSYVENLGSPQCVLGDARIHPVWSPSGEYYGCSAGQGCCTVVHDQPLVIYDVNNKIIAKLEQEDSENPLAWQILDWSPDSQYVSIMHTGSKKIPYYDFSIMKYDGSSLWQIDKQTDVNSSFDGKWSPNGKYIVSHIHLNSSNHNYLVVSSPSGEEVARFDLVEFINLPLIAAADLTWSPDSKKIAFLIESVYDADTRNELYVLDIESEKLTNAVLDESICIMSISGWAPDNKNILFNAINCESSRYDPQAHAAYFWTNVDGSMLKQITEEGYGVLNLTPDGKFIIANKYPHKGLYIMNIDGSNERQLLEDGFFVSWITP